ncbi:M17 family metallopeptidase [Telmatospirillum sp. J64-1]|uniref:leucyl aminopeptidase family protein n=1 Tax=Telmatospirillum sp. J64-1 TaxID=2502183 RepID=UPI00115D4C10|nr:leucyl aminopeptidase family protein [Telmatospirillum sp. J64-1]
MLEHLINSVNDEAAVIVPLRKSHLETWLAEQPSRVAQWVSGNRFKADAGRTLALPDENGRPATILLGLGEDDDLWAFAGLPSKLPQGGYRLVSGLAPEMASRAAFGWAMGTYRFTRFKSNGGHDFPSLLWPENADRAWVERTAAATALVRDLINTPASHMGPEELAETARSLANRHNARCRIIQGEELLHENWPAVHAVGRASPRAPRLIDLRWGAPEAPKVTIVGKGVCFDTGGLDLKGAASMKLMKKDMGGAAHALGLAQMIMSADLPVRLRVLIPAVENSVSGSAFRPGDVIKTRKGMTVEIGNTDAEGRLILADALYEADQEKPEMLLDFATLTGAARSALGVELPAMFSNNDALANDFLAAGEREGDPLWRMPLWRSYRRMLDSKVADINNVSDSPYAGAIVAGLFLQEFVSDETPWAHVDMMAWNTSSRPGRPDGGEAMTLRAAYSLIAGRFQK